MSYDQYIITPNSDKVMEVSGSGTKAMDLDAAVHLWRSMADDDNDRSTPSKPYSQVDLVYNCVNKLIDSVAGIPLVLSTIDDRIVESGPAYDFLFNNPSISFERIVTEAIGHYSLSRDVFFVFPRKAPGAAPGEMYVISGTQMHAITHNRRLNGELVGWEFRGGIAKQEFSLDEVCQWKNFNPYDRFHGIGPASAAKLNINYTYAATMFNSTALANGAMLGTILTTPGSPDADEIRRLRATFDSRHAGAYNAKRTAMLTGGMDAKTIAMSMVDMQVAELTNLSGARVCSTFGVPPAMVGLVTESQYSHGPAQRDFIFNTVIPLCRLFAGFLTRSILDKFTAASTEAALPDRSIHRNKDYRQARHKSIAVQSNLFAWFDTAQHPVVQEQQRETAEKVTKFTDAGIPLNQLIVAHDLPYEQVPWGDDWWIQMGRVPANYITEAGLEGVIGESLAEGEPADEDKEDNKEEQGIRHKVQEYAETKADEAQRIRLWDNWVISWAGLEKEYNSAIRVFFLRQERELTDKLKAALNNEKTITTKADTDQIIARVVFDITKENGKLRVINHTFFARGSELGIRQSLTESGLTGDALESAVEPAGQSPLLKQKRIISYVKLSKVNQSTRKAIARQLTDGLGKGENLQQLTTRIKKTLGSNRKRALVIARTQTAGAVSTGRHTGMKAAGVTAKAWITSGDDNVRDAHRQAGITYKTAIPIDKPFVVDGENLMYPGDPAGSAKNIINCRCLQIARALKTGKTLSIGDYINMRFFTYRELKK